MALPELTQSQQQISKDFTAALQGITGEVQTGVSTAIEAQITVISQQLAVVSAQVSKLGTCCSELAACVASLGAPAPTTTALAPVAVSKGSIASSISTGVTTLATTFTGTLPALGELLMKQIPGMIDSCITVLFKTLNGLLEKLQFPEPAEELPDFPEEDEELYDEILDEDESLDEGDNQYENA